MSVRNIGRGAVAPVPPRLGDGGVSGRAAAEAWAPPPPARRSWRLIVLLGADVAALAAALGVSSRGLGGSVGLALWPGLLFVAVWVAAAQARGLYNDSTRRLDRSLADELLSVAIVTTAAAWLAFVPAALAARTDLVADWAFTTWLLSVALVLSGRAAFRRAGGGLGPLRQRVAVVGAGEIGQLIARKLLQHPEYGVDLVGFVDPSPTERRPDLPDDLPLLGALAELPEIVLRHDIQRVVLAFSRESPEDIIRTVRPLDRLGVHVDIVPRLFDLMGPNALVHSVEGLPLIALPAGYRTRAHRAAKRLLDLVGASVALMVLAPLLAVIAAKIKRDSHGPILFRQRRLGGGMRTFTSLKFRTMHAGTPDDAHRDYIRRLMATPTSQETNGLFKLERPDDVTPFGRFLRRTSLDELPQLVNVLRGEMSLVGPRPCIEYEVDHFEPHHFERFLVPAGVTGLWQVTARARSTFREALELDVAYVRGWSLWLDLRILLGTPPQVFSRKKATR